MNKMRNFYTHKILQNQIFKDMCIYFYHSEAKLYYILFIKLFPYMSSIFSPILSFFFPWQSLIYLRKRKQEVLPPVLTNYSVRPGYLTRMPIISQAANPTFFSLELATI